MTRQHAKELWDEYKWLIAVIVLPFSIWAFKTYDATKLDAQDFRLYVQQEGAATLQHEIRDSARQEDIYRTLRYLSCRADNPRRSCIQPPSR